MEWLSFFFSHRKAKAFLADKQAQLSVLKLSRTGSQVSPEPPKTTPVSLTADATKVRPMSHETKAEFHTF